LGQRFLDEILAVQHRAHHTRAEAVEFGAKVAKYLFDSLVRHESMQLTMECSHVVPAVSVPGAAAGISALPAAGRLSDAPRRRARACPQRGATSGHGSRDVQSLDEDRYEIATTGDNGFVCLVLRGWSAPTFTPAQFRSLVYDAKVRGPICYNTAAAQTVLPYQEMKAQL